MKRGGGVEILGTSLVAREKMLDIKRQRRSRREGKGRKRFGSKEEEMFK